MDNVKLTPPGAGEAAPASDGPDRFSMSVRHSSDRSVLSCTGPVDWTAGESLSAEVTSRLLRRPALLCLDCSRCSSIDLDGAYALVKIATRCFEQDVAVELWLPAALLGQDPNPVMRALSMLKHPTRSGSVSTWVSMRRDDFTVDWQLPERQSARARR